MYKDSYQSNLIVAYLYKHHFVWYPRYFGKELIQPIAAGLNTLLRKVAAEHQAMVLELKLTSALGCGAGVSDHTHLLCEVDPHYGIHRLVQQMECRSSRLLRRWFASLKLRLPTLWTTPYFVSFYTGAPLVVLKQYIEAQKDV